MSELATQEILGPWDFNSW